MNVNTKNPQMKPLPNPKHYRLKCAIYTTEKTFGKMAKEKFTFQSYPKI